MLTLFDHSRNRKYLVGCERKAFALAASAEGGSTASFCLTLVLTDARISEVLALTVVHVDANAGAIVFETLKQRKRRVFRANPVPRTLLDLIEQTHRISDALDDPARRSVRLWLWGRTTGWKHVKRVIKRAGVADIIAKPKSAAPRGRDRSGSKRHPTQHRAALDGTHAH
jgi:integrase/recombinase XerD